MKRFLRNLLYLILPLVGIAIFPIYKTVTFPKEGQGDLGNLGFISFDEEYAKYLQTLSLNNLKVRNINSIDEINRDSAILTIGDSFSQMEKEGYQAFLQELYPGYVIYNFTGKDVSVERYQTFVDMLQDSTVNLPEIVILETVERSLYHRLSEIDLTPKNRRGSSDPKMAVVLSDISIFNDEVSVTDDSKSDNETSVFDDYSSDDSQQVNKDDVRDDCGLLDKIIDCKEDAKTTIARTQEYVRKSLNIDNPVKRVKLVDDFFSCKGHENELVYYKDDLLTMPVQQVSSCLQKLDTIFSLATKKNIKFLFLVASDKLHMYNEFTVNHKKKNAVGQLSYFSDYSTSSMFLNTRELLSEHLKNKEKDIYKCNDTHWSAKASKYVAEEISKRINAQQIERR